MNENVQKSLVMGASILVTIGIISLGLMIFSQGSSLVKESSKNMVDLTQELASQKYIAYDNIISFLEEKGSNNILALFDDDIAKVNSLYNSTGLIRWDFFLISNLKVFAYI